MVSKQIYIAVALGLLQLIAAQTTSWAVNNRQITKDGQAFTVKGVNYAPMPPGAKPTEATQWGDLFHADWAHLHDRDIPLMRAAGVNSIRIYQLQLRDPVSDLDLDHKSFFDKLYNNGVNPIYVLITYAISTPFTYDGPFDTQPGGSAYSFQTEGKWYSINETTEEANSLTRRIESNIVEEIATEYGKHPAVMGFVIGNEQNNAVTRANCKFWEWVDCIAGKVKAAAPTKLTATTIVDDDFLTVKAAIACNTLSNMDVWGINAYRGTVDQGFDKLFDDFAAQTEQALLITEFGCPASTRDDAGNLIMMPQNSKAQGDYLTVHWNDIVTHSSICSGGYAFSWVDEWWKNNAEKVQDQHDERNYAFPGTYADEEIYGLVAVEVACDQIDNWATRRDSVLPRAVYYTMGQMFGAWTELPSYALNPINYPRCNGQWVGTDGAPNAMPPVDPQGPVTSVPLPTNTPSVIVTPIDGTGNQNTNSASGVVCSVAVVALSIIALVF